MGIPSYAGSPCLAPIPPSDNALVPFGPLLCVPGKTLSPMCRLSSRRYSCRTGASKSIFEMPGQCGDRDIEVVPGMSALEVSVVCVCFHTNIFCMSMGWREVYE